jgi:spore coat polysaccharide biosynthesis predicted glycosyltransferase SpsG
MKSLMMECSVAVLSPSTVLFEYCSIGGLIFLLQIAENQKDVFTYFINNKLAFDFREIHDKLNGPMSFNYYTKQSLLHQDEVFDHQSGQRILDLFLSL